MQRVIKHIPPKLLQHLFCYEQHCTSLIQFSKYTWVVLRWIAAALFLSAWRKQITLRNSHVGEASIVPMMFTRLKPSSKWRVGVSNRIIDSDMDSRPPRIFISYHLSDCLAARKQNDTSTFHWSPYSIPKLNSAKNCITQIKIHFSNYFP